MEGSRVVDVDDVRVPGQPSRRGHLAEEATAVAFGKQDPVVDLHGHFPADGELPAPVDGREAPGAEDSPDPMPGNVRCRDHDPPA
jgi:hypothetical protein